MRHQKSGRKFSRTSSHRQAMFTNMGEKIARVTISGDADALLASKADRIADWNRTLDANKA